MWYGELVYDKNMLELFSDEIIHPAQLSFL